MKYLDVDEIRFNCLDDICTIAQKVRTINSRQNVNSQADHTNEHL